jgi:hypothetical protein
VRDACGPLLDAFSLCDTDADCESGRCHQNTCADKAADGQLCDRDADCASGWCDLVCKTPIALGGACTFGDRCAGDLRFCADGHCHELLRTGDACARSADCGAGGRCSDGHCVETLACTPAALGKPCVGSCQDGAYCDDTGDEPVCAAVIPLGDPCDDDEPCGPGNYCDGTCASQHAAGEPCDRDRACLTTTAGAGNCDFGAEPEPLCTLLLYRGQPCTSGDDCLSTFCDEGRCADTPACQLD